MTTIACQIKINTSEKQNILENILVIVDHF